MFWGEAIKTATYLTNVSPSRALRDLKTPFESWHSKKPQLKYLRKFGSVVYVHEKVRKTKFDSNAWKGIMMGYDPNGYRVWNEVEGKIFVARDVTFDENVKVNPGVHNDDHVGNKKQVANENLVNDNNLSQENNLLPNNDLSIDDCDIITSEDMATMPSCGDAFPGVVGSRVKEKKH